jgi:putative peptide zinc metalloprotease protein
LPVERPTFHESWYRVADLHPRLRSTVQISRQHFRGLPWYVIQDHTNNFFFRLAEPAYRFIGLLDGNRSVGKAWNLAAEQLGDDAPTQGEVIQLLGQLYTANLLQAEVPADTHTLFARYKKRKQREVSSYLMQIMFARIPIFDPDAFLNKWLPLLGWIFAPLGLVVWIILLSLGIYDIAQYPNWQTEIRSSAQGLLDPGNLILLYVAFAMIKACHEMGHAISCKKFGRQSGTGGEVHIIGIMFLVFTPVPYVDASSSWALTNKWHRIIVGAAGMWVELAIASVAAMIWANSSTGTMIHSFAYNIMFVAGFSTLVFNANPLLRYDGYYMLSDLLEIPNMATRGRDYIYYLVKKYVWNVRFARNPAHTFSERILLFLYAIASFIMRIFVTFSIMFYLTSVLEGTLIILATAMALAGLLTWALVPITKFVHYVLTDPELQRTRARAVLTSGATLAAVVVAVGVATFPDRARAQGVVAPPADQFAELYATGEGPIVELNDWPHASSVDSLAKKMGMPYTLKGDLLLKADNTDLDTRLLQARAQLDALKVQYTSALANDPEKAPMLGQQIFGLEVQIASLEKRKTEQIFRSPMSGVLIAPDLEKRHFAFIKRTEPMGVVANLHAPIVRVAVTNDLASRLDEEAHPRVEIRVLGRPDILLTGEVSKPAPAGKRDIFSQALSLQVGGPLTPAADDQHGGKATENYFEVQISNLKLQSAPTRIRRQFENTTDVPLLPGQRVVVRFELTPKPLAVQAWTKLRQVFQSRFQL